MKKTRDNLKRENFRSFVQKTITGKKGPESSNMAAPEKPEDNSPNTFSYDDATTPDYSGFSAIPDHAPPILDAQGLFQSGTV